MERRYRQRSGAGGAAISSLNQLLSQVVALRAQAPRPLLPNPQNPKPPPQTPDPRGRAQTPYPPPGPPHTHAPVYPTLSPAAHLQQADGALSCARLHMVHLEGGGGGVRGCRGSGGIVV